MKEKVKKRRAAILSNLPVRGKFLFMEIMLVACVLLTWAAMLMSVKNTQSEKYKEMEYNAVSAAANTLNVTVETSMSIAKSIYTNENIYSFLNTEYATQSEYYSAYYPLQQSTALNIADTNIIRECIIYTSNPTVLAGGNIRKLDGAKEQYWYKYFVKTKKPTAICIDPSTSDMILVRKLDYQNLKTGESYVCMYLEPSVLKNFADEYGFDGELYVMCSSSLLYSNNDEVSSVDDIEISPDFECLQRNYYTSEIEFYSCAAKKGFKDFVSGSRNILIVLLCVTAAAVILGIAMAHNIRRRIKAVLSEYEDTGSAVSFADKNNGNDEVGRLLDLCGAMSGRIEEAGSEFKQHSDSLVRKSSEYDSLFATAMRLDAELSVAEELSDIRSMNLGEYFPLTLEAELVKKTAEKFGGTFSGTASGSDIKVPAYSIVLIAADAFRHLNAESVSVSYSGDTAEIVFEGGTPPRSTDVIKLSAIFEEDCVSGDYSFSRDKRFNPYLRLRHCCGRNVDVKLISKGRMRFVITIKNEKVENYDS